MVPEGIAKVFRLLLVFISFYLYIDFLQVVVLRLCILLEMESRDSKLHIVT